MSQQFRTTYILLSFLWWPLCGRLRQSWTFQIWTFTGTWYTALTWHTYSNTRSMRPWSCWVAHRPRRRIACSQHWAESYIRWTLKRCLSSACWAWYTVHRSSSSTVSSSLRLTQSTFYPFSRGYPACSPPLAFAVYSWAPQGMSQWPSAAVPRCQSSSHRLCLGQAGSSSLGWPAAATCSRIWFDRRARGTPAHSWT